MTDQLTEVRFWSKVDKRGPDDCWLWTGCKNERGYGMIHFRRKRQRAHRVSAILAGMEVSDKLVRHKCDNPPCVNPRHLLPGTHADNVRDMWERGLPGGAPGENSRKTHCVHGHKFSGKRYSDGSRRCLECVRILHAKKRARKVAAQRNVAKGIENAVALVRRIASRESWQSHYGKTWEAEAVEIVAQIDQDTPS